MLKICPRNIPSNSLEFSVLSWSLQHRLKSWHPVLVTSLLGATTWQKKIQALSATGSTIGCGRTPKWHGLQNLTEVIAHKNWTHSQGTYLQMACSLRFWAGHFNIAKSWHPCFPKYFIWLQQCVKRKNRPLNATGSTRWWISGIEVKATSTLEPAPNSHKQFMQNLRKKHGNQWRWATVHRTLWNLVFFW